MLLEGPVLSSRVTYPTSLSDSDGPITPAEALTMMPHFHANTFKPELPSMPLSTHVYVGNTISFTREWFRFFFAVEKQLGQEYGRVEKNDVPYGERKQAAAKILAKHFEQWHEGPNK